MSCIALIAFALDLQKNRRRFHENNYYKQQIMKLVEEDLINALGSFMDRQSE